MAAGDSRIPLHPRNCWGDQRDAIALKPRKDYVTPVGNLRSCLIVAVSLHFEMVVSGGKVAHLQRVGMLSSWGEFSTYFLMLEGFSNPSYLTHMKSVFLEALSIRSMVSQL